MNPILQAIKSLFRGLENRISAKIAELTSKINVVQNNVKMVQKATNDAKKTANNAQKAAESAKIPIFTATSNNGQTYIINDSGYIPRDGDLIVVRTSVRNSEYVYLNINGTSFNVVREYDGDTDRTQFQIPKNSMGGRNPMLFMLNTEENFAIMLTRNINEVTSGYSVCNTPASHISKIASVEGHTDAAGSTAFVVFKNGHTASMLELMIGGNAYMPVIDRNGEPIKPDAIKAGYLHQFVSDGSNWILID